MKKPEIEEMIKELTSEAKSDLCKTYRECPYSDNDDIQCINYAALYMVQRFKEMLYNGNH